MLLERYHCLGPVRPWQFALDQIVMFLACTACLRGTKLEENGYTALGSCLGDCNLAWWLLYEGGGFQALWLRWGLGVNVGGIKLGNVRTLAPLWILSLNGWRLTWD